MASSLSLPDGCLHPCRALGGNPVDLDLLGGRNHVRVRTREEQAFVAAVKPANPIRRGTISGIHTKNLCPPGMRPLGTTLHDEPVANMCAHRILHSKHRPWTISPSRQPAVRQRQRSYKDGDARLAAVGLR